MEDIISRVFGLVITLATGFTLGYYVLYPAFRATHVPMLLSLAVAYFCGAVIRKIGQHVGLVR